MPYTLAVTQGVVEKTWGYDFAIWANNPNGLIRICWEGTRIHLGNSSDCAGDGEENIALLEHRPLQKAIGLFVDIRELAWQKASVISNGFDLHEDDAGFHESTTDCSRRSPLC